VLGRVVGAHGLRGELRVRWTGDGPENLLRVARVWLADPARGPDDPAARIHEIEGGREGRSGEVRLRLRGIEDRGGAETLRGRWVVADDAELAALPEGEHYWYQLVGCRVETADGRAVGTVRELWATGRATGGAAGAHDVLVVDAPDGTQRLIPTAGPLLREVDVGGRRIVVDDLPGLLEPQRA
jgi:16S rRNA processing protein RimM